MRNLSSAKLACAVSAIWLLTAVAALGQGRGFHVMYTFRGIYDGQNPYSGLIRDSKGNLYGTTSQGGLGQSGAVFKVNPAGQEIAIYSFGSDGTYPEGSLLRDSDGNIYGVASSGGAYGNGVVYRLSPAGSYSVLYTFAGGTDGYYPRAGLIRDAGGNLYGTTAYGGDLSCLNGDGCGTVFRLDPTGVKTVLYTFVGGTDGEVPYTTLVQDAAGNLYGTTIQGGDSSCGLNYGCGTVFKIDLGGHETVLHTFTGTDGESPEGDLIRDTAGNLYGTTEQGGDFSFCNGYGCGTVFKLSASGTLTSLHNFTGNADGGNPVAGVVQDAAGSLYGSTASGGYLGCLNVVGLGGCGTVFKLDKVGTLTTEHTFKGSPDGAYCYGGVILGPAGTLYGTASEGGDVDCDYGLGCGTVFEIIP